MKVNQLHQKEIEEKVRDELSFAEWLDYFKQKPTNNLNYQSKKEGS